ncbi:hypothetical protein HMPREF0322_03857 [Desulfitobacterium hafniense DP7]|uniref:Uncharacterized protein n=1 Tax=Desulfitobacterium hafniense DP7 TaxID=537010 RepID=G9XSA8_DESHA|nr:hypothetical protein HMPREF0322_03857 [Desulfitobacterium hafniense DP7]
MFPNRPYHALLKDDKLQTEEANNPLNDSIKARDLFFDEVTAFQQAESVLKVIFHMLLKGQKEFSAFFHFIGYPGIQAGRFPRGTQRSDPYLNHPKSQRTGF